MSFMTHLGHLTSERIVLDAIVEISPFVHCKVIPYTPVTLLNPELYKNPFTIIY